MDNWMSLNGRKMWFIAENFDSTNKVLIEASRADTCNQREAIEETMLCFKKIIFPNFGEHAACGG